MILCLLSWRFVQFALYFLSDATSTEIEDHRSLSLATFQFRTRRTSRSCRWGHSSDHRCPLAPRVERCWYTSPCRSAAGRQRRSWALPYSTQTISTDRSKNCDLSTSWVSTTTVQYSSTHLLSVHSSRSRTFEMATTNWNISCTPMLHTQYIQQFVNVGMNIEQLNCYGHARDDD